jgi:hypothetical protein
LYIAAWAPEEGELPSIELEAVTPVKPVVVGVLEPTASKDAVFEGSATNGSVCVEFAFPGVERSSVMSFVPSAMSRRLIVRLNIAKDASAEEQISEDWRDFMETYVDSMALHGQLRRRVRMRSFHTVVLVRTQFHRPKRVDIQQPQTGLCE